MPIEKRPLALSEEIEAHKATQRIALADKHENLALRYETHTIPSSREAYAEAYRRLVGVHPDQRQEYRQALGYIIDGSGFPVDDLIEEFRLDHVKMSSSGVGIVGSSPR